MKQILISDERLEQLLGAMKQTGMSPMEEARMFEHVREETGFSRSELARRVAGTINLTERRGLTEDEWRDRIIWRECLLRHCNEDVQKAVDAEQIGADMEVGELARLPMEKQNVLLEKLIKGELKAQPEIRRLVNMILDEPGGLDPEGT